MRILLLDQFSDPGGGQRMLLDLLQAVRSRGWDAVVALPDDGPVAGRVREMGFEVFAISCGPYSSGRKSATDLWRFRAELPRLARHIRELTEGFVPDVIHINGPRLLPAAAAARLEVPVLFHAHAGIAQRGARWLAGLSLRRLKPRVVAVCRNVADAWRPFVSEDQIRVIYNGVAGPAREFIRAQSGPPTVGCIGRIAPEKGQREFVTAAGRIRAALPHTRFVIAGAALFGDNAARVYERAVRDVASEQSIEFTGWVDDVYSVMSRLDLLVVPSVWDEPNPRVILEAFAAGVPVLALRAGGIPEMMDDGRTGFLSEDIEELSVRAIKLLAGDRSGLRAVARAARERWQRQFTVDAWQKNMIAELEACARANPVRHLPSAWRSGDVSLPPPPYA